MVTCPSTWSGMSFDWPGPVSSRYLGSGRSLDSVFMAMASSLTESAEMVRKLTEYALRLVSNSSLVLRAVRYLNTVWY